MPKDSINPTKTSSWKKLQNHFNDIKEIPINNFFSLDHNRAKKLSISLKNFFFDFSKQNINEETISLFVDLLNEIDLKKSIKSYFSGDKINLSENRAVLHTALRTKKKEIIVDGKNVVLDIKKVENQINSLTKKIINGSYRGFRGDKITDIVNIGIGGSDLGPAMVIDSLKHYRNHLNFHFINNVDGDYLHGILENIRPETTMFVIVSKSFNTVETLTNATTIRNWFLKFASNENIGKHFIGCTSNVKKAKDFGLSDEKIFPIWDWVGGRFSLWSSAGISINIAIGPENYQNLLDGANYMDEHFKNEEFSKNIPVIAACLTIWYNNFFDYRSHAVIPYSEYLKNFPRFLQQLSMESNGKQTDKSGKFLNYSTAPIIWGDTGTNAQHSFFQLLHQGKKIVPIDFIGFRESKKGDKKHQDILIANMFAQSKALMTGNIDESKNNHKSFRGNRPSTTILIDNLNPFTLGSLISIYENKIFTLGVIWNILSFDQFGVELGKKVYSEIMKNIESGRIDDNDSSTILLLKKYLS